MIKTKWIWGIVIFFIAITFSGSFLLYSNMSREKQGNQPTWEELAKSSLNNPTFKNRKLAMTAQQRGIASEKEERIFKKLNTVFVVNESLTVNIQKNKKRPTDSRIAAKNLNSGNSGYLSGDIVITTPTKADIPHDIANSTLSITQELADGKFVISVTPPTNVVKVYDELLKSKKFKTVELDLVDKVIQPQ